MLRAVYSVSWREHKTNRELYNGLPLISSIIRQRRLALAGHIMRHNEPASTVLLWEPDERRRIGRPGLTLKKIIDEDTGLQPAELITVMNDRVLLLRFCLIKALRATIVRNVSLVNKFI